MVVSQSKDVTENRNQIVSAAAEIACTDKKTKNRCLRLSTLWYVEFTFT